VTVLLSAIEAVQNMHHAQTPRACLRTHTSGKKRFHDSFQTQSMNQNPEQVLGQPTFTDGKVTTHSKRMLTGIAVSGIGDNAVDQF